jgi:hypothetical protein
VSDYFSPKLLKGISSFKCMFVFEFGI